MANKRKKKKKNSRVAKQAAAAYKGKNAAAKPAAPKKQAQPKAEPVVEKKPEKKAEPQKKQPQAAVKPAAPKKKKTAQKPNSFKKIKYELKKKISSLDPRKPSAIILAVSIVIAVVCIGALLLSLRFTVPDEAKVEYAGRDLPDYSMLVVTDDLVTQYEFADRMKRKGDKDKFRYYSADTLIMPEKFSSAKLNLVNVFDNDCVLIASIVDKNDNVVYQSLGLPAGRCLADINISDLSYGTHDMKLVVAAYDPESYKLIGVQYSDLTVQVGIEEEVTDEEAQEK